MDKVLITFWLASLAASLAVWSVLPVLVITAVCVVVGSVVDSLPRRY